MKTTAAASFLVFGLFAFACGEDAESSDPVGPSGTGPGVVSPGTPSTTMPPTGTTAPPTPGGTATGGGGAGPAPTAVAPGADFIAETGVPFSQGLFQFSDMETLVGLTNPEAGKVCMSGSWVASTVWGGGMGVQVATGCPDACTGFDAAALGIAGVKFTLSGVPASGVRFGVNLVAAEEDGFIPGGVPTMDFVADGEQTVMFDTLAQPTWVTSMIPWDASDLSAVQFQVNEDVPGDFEVCASGITFIDANGAEVMAPDVPVGMGGMSSGGMGGMATGGMGGMATGGMGGMATGGMGGMATGGMGGTENASE